MSKDAETAATSSRVLADPTSTRGAPQDLALLGEIEIANCHALALDAPPPNEWSDSQRGPAAL